MTDAPSDSPSGAPSDAEVVARVLDGHRDEYRVLIQRYQEAFHRFAFGMVDDPDAATDLVQDSFVKAYTNLESCNKPERFESWAYQILRNRCRDYLKNIRRTHEPLDESPALVSPLGKPAEDLERAELRERLRDALATLPGAHREAFLLKHLDGRTYQEISEELGASVSAVKMRVHRSREMLQEHLERERRERTGEEATRASPGGGIEREDHGANPGSRDSDVTIQEGGSSTEMEAGIEARRDAET